MKRPGTLLVVDDNRAILQAVKMLMDSVLETVVTADRPDGLPRLLARYRPEVVLLDMNFQAAVNTGNEGLYWLREIRKLAPLTKVVLFTAYADVALAVEGMKLGAVDFLVKPFDNDTLRRTLLGAFGPKKKAVPAEGTVPEDRPAMLWGQSAPMRALKAMVEKVAPTDANVLITGENGTGKDLLAREIHRLSRRSEGPLEIIDMGAVVETLFDSELYGHEKGSFTDAKADRPGKFETAHGGTLFLDEIGNLPYHLQAKLLTSLQQRKIVRIGSNTPRPIDIRLLCATNRNLPEMVEEGSFRQDLFYRLNTVTLELPPLRQRAEDIPAFVELFLRKYAKVYGKPEPRVAPEAMERLKAQTWPGNIRQLEHVVEKALILGDGVELRTGDFDLIEATGAASKGAVDMTLEEMERHTIAAAMQQTGGNIAEVARKLGVTRQTLYNKIRRYGL